MKSSFDMINKNNNIVTESRILVHVDSRCHPWQYETRVPEPDGHVSSWCVQLLRRRRHTTQRSRSGQPNTDIVKL